MTKIDQFESVFKAADKTPFAPEAVNIQSVVVVTDTDQHGAEEYRQVVKGFLSVLEVDGPVQWTVVTNDQYHAVHQLIELVDGVDLICTYRNLRIPANEHPHSLGVYVDVMAQVANAPVMLLPHPDELSNRCELAINTREVMAITDHLTGDHHLVSYAAKLTMTDGTLFLTHVEDSAVFERYMATIAKVPSIDTETARHDLLEQLLKEPHDYITSCREVLKKANGHVKVEEIVTVGHRLADYKRMISEHEVDLLVMNTKDEEQMAMHGHAYPLTVELRETPLLLL